MKLYILRWNPNFSMKYKTFHDMMEYLRFDEIYDFDWSIHDYEDLEPSDMFVMAQVGTGDMDGIVGFGVFTSPAYTAPNWKENDETVRFYAKMNIHCLIDHDCKKSNEKNMPLFCAKELEQKFPQVNWHTGHAGVLVPEEISEALVIHLMKNTLPLKYPDQNISFTDDGSAHPLAKFFAQYINGLCPYFKEEIIATGKLNYENYTEGETVDQSIIEISQKKFNRIKLTNESPFEDFLRFFVPVA